MCKRKRSVGKRHGKFSGNIKPIPREYDLRNISRCCFSCNIPKLIYVEIAEKHRAYLEREISYIVKCREKIKKMPASNMRILFSYTHEGHAVYCVKV